jgi:hypothetical protein
MHGTRSSSSWSVGALAIAMAFLPATTRAGTLTTHSHFRGDRWSKPPRGTHTGTSIDSLPM